jgi:hypothetical protein
MEFKSTKYWRWAVCLGLFLGSFQMAQAFPSLVRHGYSSCSTCHYSPSGGGILTPYGKFVAQELLGTFNDSQSPMAWLVKPAETSGFVANVFSRSVQAHFDTPSVQRSAFRKMQLDLEGGWADLNGWQALATVGPRLDSAIEGESEPSTIDVRRFWVGRVTAEYAFRVGKFFPEYGLNQPNHNVPTRKGLFFNHNEEPMTAQGSIFSDSFDFTLGLIKGEDKTQLEGRQGYSTTVAYKFQTLRVGASRLATKGSGKSSEANGIFGQFGYMGTGYTLVEVDEKKVSNQLGKTIKSQVAYVESGWEVYKGLVPYLGLEYTKNFQTDLIITSPQIGSQITLYTHTELVLQAGYSKISIRGEKQSAKNALAMFNIYF